MKRTNKIKKLLTAAGALTIVAAICLPMFSAYAPFGGWRKHKQTHWAGRLQYGKHQRLIL